MRYVILTAVLLTASADAMAQAPAGAMPPPATSKSITIVTPHAPVARQIAPVVPPVKRTKPTAVAATPPAKKTNPVAEAAKSPPAAAPATANALAPASPAAAAPAAPSTTSSVVQNAAQVAIPLPAHTKHKVGTTGCIAGVHAAIARKACSPTKTAAKSGASKIKTARSKTPFDQTGRSALGAKPKS